MATLIQFRRGVSSLWTSVNPILAEGEMGQESDTKRFKIGDGVNNWSSLPYNEVEVRATFETVSKNLAQYSSALNYTSGKLTSIIYTLGASVITKTLLYTGSKLTSVVLSGDTPLSIDLIKTINYTLDDVSSISYS